MTTSPLVRVLCGVCIISLCCFPHSSFAQSDEAVDLRMRGYKAQKAGALDEAISLYEQAIKADSSYASPYNDLGVAYEMKGMVEEAEKSYLGALQIDPNYQGVYSNLASLYERKGDTQRAIAYWEKRARLGDPNDQWVKNARDNAERLKGMAQGGTSVVSQPISADTQELQNAEALAQVMVTEAESRSTGIGKGTSGEREVTVTPASQVKADKRELKEDKKRMKKLVGEARNDIYNRRYQEALDKLYEAKETVSEDKIKYLDDLVDEARSRQMDYDLARATMDSDLYKKAKLVEVEGMWYPPLPDLQPADETTENPQGMIKSAARLELEKKAAQIIPSIDFTDAQLKEVVEFLAVSNGINIVIDETVVPKNETVTIHLKEIPLNEALDIILRTKGLKYRYEENIIWITTQEKLMQEDLVVQVYDVQDLVGKLFDFPSQPFDFKANLDVGKEKKK